MEMRQISRVDIIVEDTLNVRDKLDGATINNRIIIPYSGHIVKHN